MAHERPGTASRGHDQDIFLEQLGRHLCIVGVLGDFDIVASGKEADPFDIAGFNIVHQGGQRVLGIEFGQGPYKGFRRKAGHHRVLDRGDINFFVFSGFKHGNGLAGIFRGGLLPDLDVIRACDFADIHGGDHPGAHAFGNRCHRGHDTLVIHDHGIHCSRDKGHLLGDGVGARGNAVALHEFVARPAAG